MSANIMSGRDVAKIVRAEVGTRVAALAERGKTVGLATVLVGDDAASRIYVSSKHKAAEAAGMISIDRHLPSDATQDQLEAVIGELNADPTVDGMIVQLPLPPGLNEDRAVSAVDPAKDADGLHPYNLGLLLLGKPTVLPATPKGVMRLLDHYGIETSGKTAVVVGRSFLVGRPLAVMLAGKGVDATVIQAHSRTQPLRSMTVQADILIVAAGVPSLISPGDIKPGAVVIDVGTNRTEDGLVGDVDFDAVSTVASAITPVPGGVGPMTIASLLENTVIAAERSVAGGEIEPTG